MKVLSIVFLVYCSAIQAHAQFNGGRSYRCLNPNQRPGTCVSIYDCQTVMSVLQRVPLQQTDLDFAKASECIGGYGRGPHVCCASDTGFNAGPTYEIDVREESNYRESPRATFFPENNYNYYEDGFASNSRRFNDRRGGGGGGGSNSRSRQRSNSAAMASASTSLSAVQASLIPQPPTCGGVTIENKIYGGTDTDLYEFPWMVLFEYTRRAGGISINCAGSLISQRYVLTAAHCVKGAIERQIGQLTSIRLGEHDLTSQADCSQFSCAPQSLRVGIDEIIPHENYRDASTNKENDIALVRLDRNIGFSDTIRPICLPSAVQQEQQSVRAGTQYTVAGWGRTLKAAKSAVKQKLNVALIDQQQCRRKFRARKVEIADTQLCAGGKYAEDSCEGDSGGPLMRFRGGAWVLEGIVSFGVKCGLRDWPAVHTRVENYDDWIRSKLRT